MKSHYDVNNIIQRIHQISVGVNLPTSREETEDLCSHTVTCLKEMQAENIRLSGQCGRYYKAIREHCKGINRLLRKRDHHRNKADRYAVALQRIINTPMVSGGVPNIIPPYEIADAALNPPKEHSDTWLEKKDPQLVRGKWPEEAAE